MSESSKPVVSVWSITFGRYDEDDSRKPEYLARIKRSPLVPSVVYETAFGFRVDWRSKDGDVHRWPSIVADRLVPFFDAQGSTSRLTDLATDDLGPVRWTFDVSYTEQQILQAFPWVEPPPVRYLSSPIEDDLRDAMIAIAPMEDAWLYAPTSTTCRIEWSASIKAPTLVDDQGEEAHRRISGNLALLPQVRIGRYRLDFALVDIYPRGIPTILAIECDGRAFHERTVEQAITDRRRDRDVLAMGVPTIRYMGREIHAAPLDCALDVFRVLFAWRRRFALERAHAAKGER